MLRLKMLKTTKTLILKLQLQTFTYYLFFLQKMTLLMSILFRLLMEKLSDDITNSLNYIH